MSNKLQLEERKSKDASTLPVMRSLDRVRPWPLNPRDEAHYRGMDELMDDIARRGLDDAIHVWETPEADWIIKGHRRFEAMSTLGWAVCKQVVHHFENVEDALEACLSDHGHTDPLDSAEKLRAAQTALNEGLGVERTARALGVAEERVQMWFKLGEMLPAKAKDALADGRLSMNTAERLLALEKVEIAGAVQMILHDPTTNAPMGHGQAVAALESQYIKPAQWRKAWQELEIRLRKKLRVTDGYFYVPWENRLDYVLGETGQPEPQFEFADSFISRDPQGRTWGAKAKELGVTIHVVPAPRHEDKHVLLVSARMMRDAEAVGMTNDECGMTNDGEEEAGGMTNDECGMTNDGEEKAGEPVEITGRTVETVTRAVEKSGAELRALLGAVWEKLNEKPTTVMGQEVWRPLLPFLCHLTTDVDAGALSAWLGETRGTDLLARVQGDASQRAILKWTFMLLLCAESDAADQPVTVMSAVAEGLSVNVKRLMGKAATASDQATARRKP